MKLVRRLGGRLRTIYELLAHLGSGQDFFLVPLVLVLLAAALLLVVTGGLSYVAPFLYTLF